ncbi:MAG: SCP2 sterol-binding domain-containing protein [Nannocystales bacterium]
MTRPSKADTPHEVAAIMRSLPQRFRPGQLGDWSGTFHWDIRGADEAEWTVRVSDSGCEVLAGLQGEADCVVRVGSKTFVGIETGERSPMMAFAKGKIKISNVGSMRRYEKAFFKFHDVPKD